MSAAPLLTDASRLAATFNAQNFAAGVAAHINGDWARHIQLQIMRDAGGNLVPWVDSGGNFIPGSGRLRALFTQNGVNYAMVVPIIPFNAPVSGNSPAIVTQPTTQTVVHGQTATLSLLATGAPVLTYRWRFKGIIISGAVTSQLVISNVGTVNAGAYDCIVSNPFGLTTSSQVQLFVT